MWARMMRLWLLGAAVTLGPAEVVAVADTDPPAEAAAEAVDGAPADTDRDRLDYGIST